MRIYLNLSKNLELVPYDYQAKLTGSLHKWLKYNDLHDKISLYSFSWLKGGQSVERKGLTFNNGAEWFISAYDSDVIKKLVTSILDMPQVAFGMQVSEVTIRETPIFQSGTRFYLGSPALIKRTFGDEIKHFTFDEHAADLYLTETLHNKLTKAGLPTEGAEIRFDRSHPSAKTKVSTYHNIRNKANYCPVIIDGSPEQIGFAWDVGIGNSTGIGFGSLI